MTKSKATASTKQKDKVNVVEEIEKIEEKQKPASIKKITHLRLIAQTDNRETPDGKRLNKGESKTMTVEQCKGLVEQLPDGSYKLIPSLHGRGIWGLENVEAV